MFDMGLVDATDKRAHIGLSEPKRELAAQNAALAGDHQHELLPLALRTQEKPQKRAIGCVLGEAVQIEAAFGFQPAAPQMRVGMTAVRDWEAYAQESERMLDEYEQTYLRFAAKEA